MTVYLVGAGPGDPGLLTRGGGAELLGRAEVVVYDRLVDPALLSLAPPGAVLGGRGSPLGRRAAGGRAGTPGGDRRLLARHGKAGRTVVRLKGGDPFLFGRGGEEAEALTRRRGGGGARGHLGHRRARLRRDPGHPPRDSRPR